MIGRFRIRSLRARLIGAALVGLSISMALLGAAIETAHSASVNAARVERQIAQLYGLIAEAEESRLGLTLRIEVADPQLNQLESGRFAGVVDQRGELIWASASTALLNESWIEAAHESMPAFGVPTSWSVDDRVGALIGQKVAIRWQTPMLEADYTFVVFEVAEEAMAEAAAFRQQLIWWLAGAVVVVLVLQFLSLRWGLAPLTAFTRDLARVSDGRSSHLPEDEVTEFKPLAKAVNQLVSHERAQSERYRRSLTDLAHSLKTPLSILRNERALGQGSGASQPLAASVDQTVDPLDDMEQKIAYQLERAVLGQSTIALAPIEVKPVVQALFRAMEKVFRASQPTLRMELDEPTLRTDQRDLNELLGNLIENALKYGATEVLVTLGLTEHGARLSVHDDGPGIPADQHGAIMRRGHRADTRTEGQGIGLDIVGEIAGRYGSDIRYERSEPLGGAHFSVTFKR